MPLEIGLPQPYSEYSISYEGNFIMRIKTCRFISHRPCLLQQLLLLFIHTPKKDIARFNNNEIEVSHLHFMLQIMHKIIQEVISNLPIKTKFF